jgi:hypothetical protein
MRKLVTAYTFDASAQTVTLTGITVSIEKVLMIVNQTDGLVIYDPHTPGSGGSAAGSIITLAYDTTSMADTDKLLVFYEDDGVISDLVTNLGARADSAATTDTGTFNLIQLFKRSLQYLNALVNTDFSTEAKQDDQITAANALNTLTGAVNETAPASDTASSGLNGRLQRIAQNLTSLFGAKTTSVTALETGGSGVIGWLSQIWRDIKGGIVLQAGANAIGTVEVTKVPKASSANTPSIGTSAATVISSNAARKSWGVQNLGTNTLYVRMGASASSSVFHFALAPGSGSDDGYGASVSDDVYTGDVSVAGTSPRYTTYEL